MVVSEKPWIEDTDSTVIISPICAEEEYPSIRFTSLCRSPIRLARKKVTIPIHDRAAIIGSGNIGMSFIRA